MQNQRLSESIAAEASHRTVHTDASATSEMAHAWVEVRSIQPLTQEATMKVTHMMMVVRPVKTVRPVPPAPSVALTSAAAHASAMKARIICANAMMY
jgi:hypothetical protein